MKSYKNKKKKNQIYKWMLKNWNNLIKDKGSTDTIHQQKEDD